MFILKGGMMSVVWGRGFNHRPTMDVDLEFRGRLDEGKAREMLVKPERYIFKLYKSACYRSDFRL